MKELVEVIAKAFGGLTRMKSLSVRSRKAEPQYWSFMLQKAIWEK